MIFLLYAAFYCYQLLLVFFCIIHYELHGVLFARVPWQSNVQWHKLVNWTSYDISHWLKCGTAHSWSSQVMLRVVLKTSYATAIFWLHIRMGLHVCKALSKCSVNSQFRQAALWFWNTVCLPIRKADTPRVGCSFTECLLYTAWKAKLQVQLVQKLWE